jgi:hypothetical protein
MHASFLARQIRHYDMLALSSLPSAQLTRLAPFHRLMTLHRVVALGVLVLRGWLIDETITLNTYPSFPLDLLFVTATTHQIEQHSEEWISTLALATTLLSFLVSERLALSRD